jgi:hypothetical protein
MFTLYALMLQVPLALAQDTSSAETDSTDDTASTGESVSHDSIWTSGQTLPKDAVAIEIGTSYHTLERSLNGDINTALTEILFIRPALHIRYGLLPNSELFTSITSRHSIMRTGNDETDPYVNTVFIGGIKQQIYRGDTIPISVQTRMAYQYRMKERISGTHSQYLMGVGSEIRLPFLHSSIEVLGMGANFSNDSLTNYSIDIQSGHTIPLFAIQDAIQSNLVIAHTYPIRVRDHAFEIYVSEQSSANAQGTLGGVTYMMYQSLQAGLHLNIHDKFQLYTLFATTPSFTLPLMTQSTDVDYLTLQPWTQTTDSVDIDANQGVQVMLSSIF